MADKIRCEVVFLGIIQPATKQAKDYAWRFLRSVSAKAEADIVNASRLAQNEIVSIISNAKARDVKDYNTKRITDKTNATLGKLVSDCEIIARRMIVANVLAGKVKSVMNVSLAISDLQKAVALNDSDHKRINDMANDIVSKIKHGVSLAMSSVNMLVNNASVKANMVPSVFPKQENQNLAKQDEKQKKPDATLKIKQEPISNEFSGADVENKRPQRIYVEKLPTKDELLTISENPIAFASNAIKANTDYIVSVRSEYLKEEADKKLPQKEEKKLTGKDIQTKEVINSLSKDLDKNGLFAFTDKGGKRWTLISYCSMMARTTSTQSTNIGDMYSDEEHDLYYIVPHPKSCPICAKVEGKVYSRSGTSRKYPPLASVFPKIDPAGSDDLDNRYFSIHPNCRHVIVKYVEND